MRKLSVIYAGILLATMLAGCGPKQDPMPAGSPAVSETAAAVTTAETTAASEAAAVIPDSPVEFARQLKLGWNLGNTLDATGKSDLSSETAWGQPETTKEMIDFVKASGFTSIRIPVSWGQHTGADYAIKPEWMARVTEVVDYAYDQGMYVIINSHHDNNRMYYYPDDEHYERSEKYIRAIWTQIAENFKDYDEHLIFEAMNEPRLSGTDKEWWFPENDEEGVASIKNIVKLNQVFVDTVRASGGNNATRFLMVPSNAASPNTALNNAFEMPSDSANRLMVSIHAYTPYDFTMNFAGGYSEWKEGSYRDLGFMDQLEKKFIQNGYGVVIGEFGATNKDNLESRIAWAKDYTNKASSLGIPCFLWDNGGTESGDENFGMIDRNNSAIFFPELLDAMKANYQ